MAHVTLTSTLGRIMWGSGTDDWNFIDAVLIDLVDDEESKRAKSVELWDLEVMELSDNNYIIWTHGL